MAARYVVSLYLDRLPDCRVTQEIRRADDDRAVFYAQEWLHRHRVSFRYMGMSFDRWSVERPADDESTREVATGVDTRPVPTQAEQTARKRATASRLKPKGSVVTLRPMGGRPRRASSARPASRLAQAVAIAKQKVANDGIISTLGSNQDS